MICYYNKNFNYVINKFKLEFKLITFKSITKNL
jgi:hypothetical protein